MIVAMKKILLLTLEKYKRETLESLREVGIIHLESYRSSTEILKQKLEEKEILMQALSFLEDNSEVQALDSSNEKILLIARNIIKLNSELKELVDTKTSINIKKELVSKWGNFSLIDINELRDNNKIYVQFFKAQMNEYKLLLNDPNINVLLISNEKDIAYFVTFGFKEQKLVEFTEFKFDFDLESLNKKQKVINKILEQKTTQLELFNKYKHLLKENIRTYFEEIEFEQVCADMKREELNFTYITGFVPVNKIDLLKDISKKSGIAIKITEPQQDDSIPTYIEYKGFSKLAKPIFAILETVPGYKEKDVSFLFVIFFFIFFGMIIGDAAYGIIFFMLGVIWSVRNMVKNQPFTALNALTLYLSISAIIWGAMTGTWFGSSLILERYVFLQKLKVDYLTTQNSMYNVMFICFTIGVFQIGMAHLWNFCKQIKQKPYIHAFTQLGWLSCVIGLYYLVLNLIIGKVEFPMYDIFTYMIYFGIGVVFIFNKQDGSNFFKCILKGLAGLMEQFLSTISMFADIISYIRLFAVGLAGLSISKSFNGMSESLLQSDNIGFIFAGILVVFFGHVLNIILSLLSVVVHGIRLNMLEFSNHLGQEWSGYSYKPFKRIKK